MNDQFTVYHVHHYLGNTPLHEAAFFARDDAVKALLKAGANWKFVNKLGWTSLHVSHFYVKHQRCVTIVPIALASCSRQLSDYCGFTR
jgi:hypothetical protein